MEVWEEGINDFAKPQYVKHAFANQKPEIIEIYDRDVRHELDGELTERAIEFIKKNAKEGNPSFTFIPYTQTHYPVEPSKEFAGKSGRGRWGDVLMQMDAYTGRLLDAVEDAGIADNTIFIFTSDNGPEFLPGQQGWGGPWRGSYFTGLEAHYAFHSLFAGQVKSRQAAVQMKSFTRWTFSQRSQILLVVQSQQTALSMA